MFKTSYNFEYILLYNYNKKTLILVWTIFITVKTQVFFAIVFCLLYILIKRKCINKKDDTPSISKDSNLSEKGYPKLFTFLT